MEKSLSAKDICSIVKACASSGVREITLKDVTVKFGPVESVEPAVIHYTHSEVDTPANQATELTQDELDDAQNQELDDLFISNPAEYERRRLEDNNE